MMCEFNDKKTYIDPEGTGGGPSGITIAKILLNARSVCRDANWTNCSYIFQVSFIFNSN